MGTIGGWPTLAQVSFLDGAPSKLRLGGAFDFQASDHPRSLLPKEFRRSIVTSDLVHSPYHAQSSSGP